jgi:hypothetical protein
VLEPLIYHGGHRDDLGVEEHVLVQELSVKLAVLELRLLLLILHELELVRGLDQEGLS